jgi:hypothetical protein
MSTTLVYAEIEMDANGECNMVTKYEMKDWEFGTEHIFVQFDKGWFYTKEEETEDV